MASPEQIRALECYNACDVSDALLKLNVPGAGFLPDLQSYGSHSTIVAPASTVLFVPKGAAAAEHAPPANIPNDTHWADLTTGGTIVVIQQPPGQTNAVCGGIMAVRMHVRGAKGIVVAGRVRDLEELKDTNLPVWARGLSTVGAGAASTPRAVEVPLHIDGTVVNPGDLVFSDPVNGVVVIPQDKVQQVLELLPVLKAADDKVKRDVLRGVSVYDAFREHRRNL
ncbi:DlpA domain-containing protein [Plectosphaerella plurivora]|uniref:DlpA domain-containing protein n=1 Tax=Plectosphaerella plurivora TaxID=936078 RepID=A0A9P8V6S2_9PEZI|nr:DlpA domain-containing protein [Plectosphaerella plurivora]